MIKKYTIGRNPENQIVLNYPMISSFHADLIVNNTEAGTNITLVDHSTNGTYINGQKLSNSSCYIAYGDIIVFPGNVMFDWGVLDESNFQMPSNETILCTPDSLHSQRDSFKNSFKDSEEQNVTFVGAIEKFFNHYTDFDGRSRRKEVWFMYVWQLIFLCGMFLISLPFFIDSYSTGIMVFYGICCVWSLAIFVPGLALMVRRIHDVGQSGWFYLFILVPIVNFVFCCIWLFKDSEYKVNQWGPCPKKIY